MAFFRHIKPALILLLVAALPGTARADDMRLMAATSGATNLAQNGAHVWITAFLEAMGDSGFEVRLYPGSVLGKDRARTELIELGLLQVNIAGGQEVEPYSQTLAQLKMPFLFDDYDHFQSLVSSSGFLARVNEEVSGHNMVVLAFPSLGGMVGLFNTKKSVRQLSDAQALRLRALDFTQLDLVNGLGARGTQVAWEEVAQAMETGVVDGYINPPLVPIMFGHTNQIRFFSDLRFYPSYRIVVASARWVEAMTPEKRAALRAAVQKADAANTAWRRKTQMDEIRMLQASGVEISVPEKADRAAFVASVREHFTALGKYVVSDEVWDWIDAAREQGAAP